MTTQFLNTEIQLDKNFPLDVIFVNLDIIAKMNVGEKYIYTDKYLKLDKSYVKSISRWYNGFSRFSILEFINKIIIEAHKQLYVLRQNNNDTCGILWIKLVARLKNSIVGLSKLKQTYSFDTDFGNKIDILINNLLTF
jgi:hypothetical protein